MAEQNIPYGVETKLNTNTFTKTNSVFLGWNTKSDGSGTSYTNGQKVTDLGNITLYAMWHTHTGSSTLGGGCYTTANYENCGTFVAQYKCSGCGAISSSSGTHTKSVFSNYKCSSCGQTWSSYPGSHTYRRDMATSRVYYCSTCSKEWTSSPGSHTTSGYKCQYCKKESITATVIHNATKWARYKCPVCGWLGDKIYASDYSGSYPSTHNWSYVHTGCSGASACTFVSEVTSRCTGASASSLYMQSATITCPGSATAYWKCSVDGNRVTSTCYHTYNCSGTATAQYTTTTCGTYELYNYKCNVCGVTSASSGTHKKITSYSLGCGYK